ncbi:MAG: hypothetical protein VX516_04970, partial [Actinomycetota bacterium]|nr:hypothetical protein [Actinomycetota bacterium]
QRGPGGLLAGMTSAGPAAAGRLSVGLVGLGAVGTILSGWVTWVEVVGSSVTGFRMAELWVVVGDDLGGGPPGWVGIVWYLVPLAGAASVLLLTWPGPPRARPSHGLLGGVAVLVAVLVAVAANVADATRTGTGLWLAGMAGTMTTVGGSIVAWKRRRDSIT